MNEALLYKIKEVLPAYKVSTLKNMLILVLAILQKETVCLYKLKGNIGSICDKTATKGASHYRRATRFFSAHAFSSLWLDVLALALVMLRHKVDYLVLDGTSWQYGQRKLHLLTLCGVYKGVAISIFWEDLAKQGTSNCQERKDLLLMAMQRLNLSGKILLADREYIGTDWFKFLKEQTGFHVFKTTFYRPSDLISSCNYFGWLFHATDQVNNGFFTGPVTVFDHH